MDKTEKDIKRLGKILQTNINIKKHPEVQTQKHKQKLEQKCQMKHKNTKTLRH